MSYLIYEDAGFSPSGKTQLWNVLSLTRMKLGRVAWFSRWRKYVFYPESDMLFDSECLWEIAIFCGNKTREHRERFRN